MPANVLDNLARWNLQIALLALVAALLVRFLKVNAPVVRHAVWRTMLLACLVLPLVQPWRSIALPPVVSLIEQIDPAPQMPSRQSIAAGQLPALDRVARYVGANWGFMIAIVLVCGVVLRLLWLALGIFRLQRLRRGGVLAPTGQGCEELRALIAAGAEIRCVDRIGQPVTFGVLRPAVLLPSSFSELPEGIQRAVLAHELWHVRRRDWAWVLLEEVVRAAFWFNPAMWWLVSRVQSSREEVVDELTVQLTNARKTYLEALLAFADQPTLFPATPFARRRHLFHRMLLISREAVMSSKRIVVSSAAMAAAMIATGLYAASAFPLKAAPAPPASPAEQGPPRDRRPGEAGPETARERELKQSIAEHPERPEFYFKLAELQEGRGARSEADATLTALKSTTNKPDVTGRIAGVYVRSGQFDRAIAMIEDSAAADPSNVQAQQLVATFYFQKASSDTTLSPTDKLRYIDSGIAATDRALSSKPDYMDALIYKDILLRLKANMEGDPASRQALIAEADVLRNRAMELKKTTGQEGMAFVPAPGQPPPPPPPPPPPADLAGGQAPIRVGGNVKPPAKVHDEKPLYPPDAFAAGVQGVVVMEATVDTSGGVMALRVLRSVPMLDQAALDAVRQWRYQPTMLNGVYVPVIMTVTVNFSLQ